MAHDLCLTLNPFRPEVARADNALADHSKTRAESPPYERGAGSHASTPFSFHRDDAPFCPAAGRPFPEPAMAKAPGRVAVIDDDRVMLEALDLLLSSLGYDTELYQSAEAFLNAAPTSKATCLLVDIQLGESSGLELARRLKQRGFHFPLIFMSGSDDELTFKQAINAGAVAFLRKPFSADLLMRALIEAER